jgi:hypothetical protein
MSVPTAGQTRLVIVGATGTVGGYALRYALENAAAGSVTAIVRRKLCISHGHESSTSPPATMIMVSNLPLFRWSCPGRYAWASFYLSVRL